MKIHFDAIEIDIDTAQRNRTAECSWFSGLAGGRNAEGCST